ncbi:unnamed protein product [Leptosia nina]|uniref:EF-hand domain-containing protein n=1 Tax=Leptosia nina TaxID=320188 RepID=A0AAV1J6Q7_9NEOP
MSAVITIPSFNATRLAASSRLQQEYFYNTMAHGYPPNRDYLWNIFRSVDKDGSGFITADELQQALSNGTWSPFNPETVRLMIGMFDKQNRGSISFEDFGILWKYVSDWQSCFRSFDNDNSGNINEMELKNALSSFGYRVTDEVVSIMIRKFDRFGRGTILFDDFIQCCVTLNSLTAAFRQYDTDGDGVITIHYEQFLKMVISLRM